MKSNCGSAMLGCGMLLAAICSPMASAQQSQGPYDENWLISTAADLNKSLPRLIDPDTRWDRVTPGPGLRLIYTYTLIKQEAGNVDVEKFHAGMQALLRKSVCSRENMQDLMKNGVKLAYTYRGSDGRFVSLLEVAQAHCG